MPLNQGLGSLFGAFGNLQNPGVPQPNAQNQSIFSPKRAF